MSKDYKKIALLLWLAVITSFLSLYVFQPQLFAAEALHVLFVDNLIISLCFYFFLSTVRVFTLLPITPFMLSGALVMPPLPLFLVTMLSVLASSCLAYYLGSYLGFGNYFNRRYPQKLEKLQTMLLGREIPIIVLWSFLPIVPTDMVCYVSEIMRVPLWKCLLGVMLGSSIMCAVYIFGMGSLADLIWGLV